MLVLGREVFRCWGKPVGIVVLCAISFHVRATSVIAPRFETLVDRAELIFTGWVVGQRSEWRNNNGQRSIVTLVTFTVQQMHKGRAEPTVTLQFLGGSVGDVTLEVADMPKFKPGERVILFVEGNGSAVSPVIGFFHGRFSLQRDESGREAVFTYRNEPLVDVSEIGRAKRQPVTQETRRALAHDEFCAKIRERLSTGTRK
jgi:hypothetical protein